MRALDRLVEVGQHHDRAADTLAALGNETQWAVCVDAEYSKVDETVALDGVLSHDGETLRFIAWSGRRVLESLFEEIVVMRSRNGRLHLRTDEVSVQFEQFRQLDTEFDEVPSYAAEIGDYDPFAGLLSWLPSAANVL